MLDGPCDLRCLVTLGERLRRADDEATVATACLEAVRAALSSPAAAFVTDRHGAVEGAEWDVATLAALRAAALERATGEQITPGEVRLGARVVVCLPLFARGEVVGALAAVRVADPERTQLLLGSIAQQASAVIDRQRALAAAESRLMAIDRLASLGSIAAGIGHEIANPLASIMLNNSGLSMRLARANLPAGVLADSQRLIDENDEALERIRSIVAELRTYVRKDDGPQISLDVRSVVDSSLRLARGQLRDLDVSRQLHPVGAVLGSPPRLGQVLINLLVNAAQAVKGVERPRIEVRTEQNDDEIVVTVADNGPGIAGDHLPRIFDVYFTTKEQGQGTGLGLAIARDIVSHHGGRIEVESSPGQGATFRVVLPALHVGRELARGSQSPVSPAVRPARRRRGAVQGAEAAIRRPRLLVVDDDVSVLRSLARRLDGEFEVVPARSGKEADAIFATQSFDVLLCDINLPGENGLEVAKRLCARDHRLLHRAVYMTGGTMNDSVRFALAEDPRRVVAKPFDVTALVTLLKSIAAPT